MTTISHALVLPNLNFTAWYRAVEAYTRKFERVTIVRSLGGNDLNRFRDVSAPLAPNLWFNNDPLTQIRRAYPNVVRVDVLNVNTPDQLAALLNERIVRSDRYGEYLRDGHLNDRFTIIYPCDGRPAKIVRTFNTVLPDGRRNEGIDINAPAGAAIRAAIAGQVLFIGDNPAAGWGKYVITGVGFQVTPGTLVSYNVIYTNLKNLSVSLDQPLKVGDKIGEAAGPTSKIIVQHLGKGLPGYLVNDVVDPSPLIYWSDIRLRPTADGVRIREKPGTQYRGLGQVYVGDVLETLEMHGRTLEKLGEAEAWVKIRSPLNITGFVAAWMMSAITRENLTGTNMTAMNLDLSHPLGKPAPNRLTGLGWLRFPYKATPSQGFPTLQAAHTYHEPFIRQYAEAGFKQIIILTHQTFGEGMGYHWERMYASERGRWNEFIPQFANWARQIAQRYAGKDWVHAYQIWNEQDTPPGTGHAAVPMMPEDYARLLTETTRAIRSVDPTAKVITGGHIGGPSNGAAYARAVISALPGDARPDGIGIHSYGRGAPTSSPRYTSFGSLADDVNTYEAIMPGLPVWITEWGVLDKPDDAPEAIARYAREFLSYAKNVLRRKIVCAAWYAWADTMHNGYGLVDRENRPKPPLYDDYLNS
ncbi:hypothetical protein FBR02_04540 [Anaerolineae bacterium CFX9]|jgi:hypothetical protein|nr:hypothetical protein [Anaerolineae bacterium CFX9]